MEQEKIIKFLAAFFRSDTKRIQSALVIGSFGRGEASPSSDIDIELLLSDEKVDVREFTDDIIQLFNDSEESLVVKHTIWLADQRKLALYHGPKLLLTELFLYCKFIIQTLTEIALKFSQLMKFSDEISQFDKYFLGSRIFDLSKCILVDREGIVRQHLQYILTLPYDDPDELIGSLVGSIQLHLESSSTARRRSDAYKFYFLSNIALHELIRLAYVLDGKLEYNYNPPQYAVNSNLTSTMNLAKSGSHLKNLIQFFRKQLDRCENAALTDKVHEFCQDLAQRDSI